MGTSSFAAIILQELARWADGRGDVRITALYCQPDRPAGRGHKLLPPPAKMAAQALHIPVFQPLNFKDEAAREALRALAPDVLAVASYGLILPQSVLDIPAIAPINVHASLLPRLRGAAPIERAIMNGDIQTGVTIMHVEAALDAGPMLAQRAMGIDLDETAGDLHDQLAQMGAALLAETLDAIMAGRAPAPVPQDHSLSTYAAKLSKEEGFIDWARPVRAVHAHLRGVTPRPGGRTIFHIAEKQIMTKLTPPRLGRGFFLPFAGDSPPPPPGTILGLRNGHIAIACADAAYLIPELCPADKRPMPAGAFWNGYLRGAEKAFAALPPVQE